MKIEIVNVSLVDEVWPLINSGFQVATRRFGDDLSSGELWQMCRSGNAFLIVAYEEKDILVSCVVRFERWNNGSILRVVSLAGKRIDEWAHQVKDFLSNMARNGGAKRIVAEGREGWSRIFDEPKKLRSTYVMEIA